MRSLKLPKKFLPKLFSVFLILYVAATLPSLISAFSTFVHIIQAAFLEKDGKVDDANTALRQAIKPHFLDGLVSYSLGNTLNKQGKLNEAIAAYRQALKISPNYAAAYNNLGGALYYQGKLDEAIAAYRQAIQLDPKSTGAYYNLGNALSNQGKLDEAIATYRQAIQVNPKDSFTYVNLGNALRDQGKLDEAIATYRKSIQLVPKRAFCYTHLSNALQQQGKLEEAIKALKQAIALEPNNNTAKFYFKEAQRLLAFRQKPQLRVMPERLPSPKAEPLVSLKRSIVQIIIKSPSNWETATGWVVKREGSKAWIVTNRHVVAEGNNTPPKIQKIEVEFYSEPPPGQFRKRQSARIAKMTPADSKLDLSLLEVTDIPKDIKPLPISPTAVSLHAPIRTIGHPNTIGDWKVAKGEVSNKTDQQLQLSTITALGSSGSPVLDSRDRVVGVVWGGGYIPQRAVFGYSVAFPMQLVKEQLVRWGIR